MSVDLSVFRDALPYRGLKTEDWMVLSEALTEVKLPPGGVLFREGDPGDGFYFIRAGHIRIRRMVVPEGRKEPQEQLLTVLDAGSIFGEMALIEGDTRSADAVSEEASTVFHLSGASYGMLKEKGPATALNLQDLVVVTLCSRLRTANKNFEIIKFWLT